MAQDLSGQIIGDKYRLDSRVSEGFTTDLYKATHRLMDKAYSVRLLHPGLAMDSVEVESFFEKCKTEASIKNPGVADVVDFGTDRGGLSYCLYESLPDDSLRSLVEHDGQFPFHTALSVSEQVAFALAAAHSNGLVHGNLTTDNVLLSNTLEGGIEAKVVDFGSPNPIISDREGTTARDFAYLSPEQCSGSDQPTFRSDIYSAGVILYELIAGVPPFTGERPTDVMLKHIEEMPAPLSAFRPNVPDGVEQLILKALAKDPEMRHGSADELAAEIAALQTRVTVTNAAAAGGGFWKTALMMIVGIGLLAAALIYATSVKQTDPVTALQADANGQPVQPLNPATGVEERNLASVPGMGTDANSNMSLPGTLPGGDGYDPWANSRSLQPPGGTVTIDPSGQSPFTMDPGCTMLPSGLIICPTQVPVPNPTPTPRGAPPVNTNTAPASTPAPRATPAPTRVPEVRPSSTPRPAGDPES